MAYIGKKQGFRQKFERSELTLLREDIEKYVIRKTFVPTNPLFLDAKIRTLRAFQLDQPVKMLHLNDIFKQDLPIWSSSPGLPWTQLGYGTRDDIRSDPKARQQVRWVWHRMKSEEKVKLPDCCAYGENHIVDRGEIEVRTVWGYPAAVTYGEEVFAFPLISAYKERGYPIAYGFETGNAGCKKIYNTFKGGHYLGIHFKGFYKTLPAWLIEIAFDALAYNIDYAHYEEGGEANAAANIRMFEAIKDYAINTRIRITHAVSVT